MSSKFLKSRTVLLLPSDCRKFGDWERSRIKHWIEVRGGTLETKLSSRTTHVVCDKLVWDDRAEEVQEVLEAISFGQDLFVVQFKWLADSLLDAKKHPERKYLLQNRAKNDSQRPRETNTGGGDVSTVESIADVLAYGTNQYVRSSDAVKQRAAMDQEEHERKELEEQKRAEVERQKLKEKKRRKEHAEQVRRGVAKPKNEQFADDHNVYRDSTGFAYEVKLIKIDCANNCNARVTLTLYESKSEPRLYALNMHSAGSSITPMNTVLACHGTNFSTAYRLFCRAFLETTKVKWNKRFEAFAEGSQHLNEIQALTFSEQPFVYHIPAYGSQGRIKPSATRQVHHEDVSDESLGRSSGEEIEDTRISASMPDEPLARSSNKATETLTTSSTMPGDSGSDSKGSSSQQL